MAFFGLLEFGVAGDENAAFGFLADAAGDVDLNAIAVLDLFRGREFAAGAAAEEEQLTGPGAGKDIFVSVAVEVHQLWTEPDTSASGDAAVVGPVFEFDTSGEADLFGGAFVAIDPEDAVAELADEQIRHAVEVEIADEGGGVADVGVDRLACGLD